MAKSWETLDVQALLVRRQGQHEATVGGNVGAYPVPMGTPLRAPVLAPPLPSSPIYTGGTVLPDYHSVQQTLDGYAKATRRVRRKR
jgi:hypothetical protein